MPPHLTETWSTTYVQTLIALLVFALGMPPLIYQLSLPREIGRVAQRQGVRAWRYVVFAVSASALASLAFIWFLHFSHRCFYGRFWDFVGAALVTAVVILVGFPWVRIMLLSSPEALAGRIGRNSIRGFARTGGLVERSLGDLAVLGAWCTAGDEKGRVLATYTEIARVVQSAKGYRGAELVDVIRGIETTLTSKDHPGADSNLITGCDILSSIRQRAANAESDRDSVEAGRAIGRLGSFAGSILAESTAFALLQAMGTDRRAIMGLGLSALATDRFLVALAALNQLESLEEREANLVAGKSSELLGLLAYFWTKGGSSRLRAEAYIGAAAGSFTPSFEECVLFAQRYHYQIAEYGTSDRLGEMLADIRQQKK